MGIFRTKLDFSDNRQVKQRIETTTNLSGATTFGVPFGDLPSGPNLTLSSVTQTFDNISSTFSGNNTTTIFTWGDANMGIADSVFSAITPSTSADTQDSGNFYVPVVSSYFNIDGNTGYTQYSGVSYDMQITDMVDLGGGNYSGDVFTFLLEYISTNALDFTGRTIWNDVSGITRTQKLIISDMPVSGYVWTCIDSEGMGEWQYNGSSSGATLYEVGAGSDSTQRIGVTNSAGGNFSSALGGSGNTTSPSAQYATIVGGRDNSLTGKYNFIGGGQDNSNFSVDWSSIVGGRGNRVEGEYSFIGGGRDNIIFSGTGIFSEWSSILGGRDNRIEGKNIHIIGSGITGSTYDTTYVNKFNIGTLATGTSINNLGIDASGNVVIGSSGNTLSEVLINGNSTGNNSIHVEDGYGIGSIALGTNITTGVQFNNFELTIKTADSDIMSPTYGSSEIRFTPTGLTIGTVAMVGSFNFRGVEYEQNYSTNFTNRSLVDKEYVDRFGLWTAGTGVNSAVLGGSNITANIDDTVYVPNMIINTGGTTSMLGINTDSPQHILDVHASTGNFFFSDSAGGLVYISGITGLPRFQVSAGVGGVGTGAGGTIGMRAWDDVIYTTYGQPGDMHIYAGVSSNGLNLISADGSGVAEDYIRFYAGRGAGNGDVADIHIHGTGVTAGYVGVGTNNPSAKLHVSGNTRVSGNGRFESIGSSASAGALHYTADGTLTTNTSDERLKTNITTLTGALDKVNQLRGVTYNWIENPTGDTRIGFIAQEVNAIVPELTFTNPNSPENYMGVHYDNVTALLVEAVKELSSGVTTSNNTHLETQTVLAEDNNIELNYSGTPETAIGGGIRVLHALGNDIAAELITDVDGNFVTNNDLKPQSLTIPLYTPTSSNDATGSEGNITRDDNYLYIKSSNKWKRVKFEEF